MTGFPASVQKLIRERAGAGNYSPGRGWVDCERCGFVTGVAQLHHRRPRGAGGSRRADTNVASNGCALCPACHAWVESHRLAALETGLLVRQSDRPADVPVRVFDTVRVEHKWVLLTDTGGVVEIPAPAEGMVS